MRISTGVPSVGLARVTAREISDMASTAEEVGFDGLWGADRLFIPEQVSTPYPGGPEAWDAAVDSGAALNSLDPYAVAGAVLAGTERVRYSWSTLNPAVQHPIHLARALTTLDVLSDGRVDCGFGLDWMKDDFDITGVPWERRAEVYDDVLDFLHVWWTQDDPSYDGPFFTLPPSRTPLRPVQAGGPPIYLAGLSLPAMRRIGRRADGWLALDGLPEEFDTMLWDEARRSAEAAGRDPDGLRRIVRANALPGESVDDVVTRVERIRDAGAYEVIVEFLFNSDVLQERLELATRVLRRVRGN